MLITWGCRYLSVTRRPFWFGSSLKYEAVVLTYRTLPCVLFLTTSATIEKERVCFFKHVFKLVPLANHQS